MMMHSKLFNFSHHFFRGEIAMGFWSYAKKVATFAISFFILKALTVYQFGVYQLLLSLYAIVSDVVHDAFSPIVVNDLNRFIGEGREREAKRLFLEYSAFRIGFSAVPLVGILLAAPLLHRWLSAEMITWFTLLSGLFIIEAVTGLATLTLGLRLQFHATASRPTVQKLVQLLILAYFYFFSNIGITEVLISQLVSPLATVAVLAPLVVRAWKPWRVRGMEKPILWHILRSYGKWEVPQLFFRDLIGKLRPWIIKAFIGTEAVGLFGIANISVSMLRDAVTTRTLSALIPRKIHEEEYLNFLFIYGTKYFMLLGLAVALLGAVGFPIAVTVFFPPYAAAIPLFYILLPSILIFTFTKVINLLLLAKREQKLIFVSGVVHNLFTLSSITTFLYLFRFVGLAWGEVVGYLLSTAAKYVYLVRTGFIIRFPFKAFFVFTEGDRRVVDAGVRHFWRYVKRGGARKQNDA